MRTLTAVTPLLLLFLLLFPADSTMAQDHPGQDTVYTMKGVTISPITAAGRTSPVTFSETSRDEIRQAHSVQDLPVLLSDLPSTTTYSENGNGIGYTYLNIRGFDQRRISVMINGIPQNDPEDHNVYWIDFPDLAANLEGIHVQRGAGSSFYGPPAIGGSVNLVANPFRPRPGVTLESMFGFQEFGGKNSRTILNTRKFSVAVNSGPVADRYLFYGRLGVLRSTGYRLNSWVNMNSFFLGAVRTDPSMTTQLHIFGGPISDGLAYFGLPKFAGSDPDLRRENLSYWEVDAAGTGYAFKVSRRPQETENFSQPHYEILHEWRPADNLTVSNTLFHYTGDGHFDYDASWADTSLLRIGYTYGIPATANPGNALVRAHVGNAQTGWLPRIRIQAGDHNLTVGTELRIHRSTHWGKIAFADRLPPGFDPDYHFYEYDGSKEIFSLYAHDVIRVTGRLSVMAEIQLAYNRYGIGNEKYLGNEFNVSYFFANPRVGLNYALGGPVNAYLSAAHTSREPRLRQLYAAEDSYFGATPRFRADTSGGTTRYDFDAPLAKPERLLDFEGGVRFATATAVVRVNLFWMEFSDEIIKSGQVDIFGQPVTGNAERTRHTGIEVEAKYLFAPPFSVSCNFTASRNRLVRHRVFGDDGLPVSLDGNPVAGFPDFLANLRVDYASDRLSASVTAKYVGPFYTDNERNAVRRNSPFWIANAIALYSPGIGGPGLVFRFEARNVFNRLYFQSGEGDAFFPAAGRNYLAGVTLEF